MSGSTSAPPPDEATSATPASTGPPAQTAGDLAHETASATPTSDGRPVSGSESGPESGRAEPGGPSADAAMNDAAMNDASMNDAATDGQPADATDAAAGEPKSKAGRNLPAAILVGVILVGIALASLYWQLWLFVVLIVVAIVMGTAELANALASRGIHLARIPLLIAAIAMPVLGYGLGPDAAFMGFGLLFLFMLSWRLFRRGTDNFVRDATASGFVLSYAPLMGAFAALIAASPDGADRVLVFIVLSIASDIGGYAAGVLFGKHPMAPSISPKKSWEGFAGSVTLQVILGAILFVVLLESDWWKGAIVGAVMTVTATIGDFLESGIKRDMGIKDMSNVLPGHGGVMDRLDSLIPNTVVAYTLFALTLGGIS